MYIISVSNVKEVIFKLIYLLRLSPCQRYYLYMSTILSNF